MADLFVIFFRMLIFSNGRLFCCDTKIGYVQYLRAILST